MSGTPTTADEQAPALVIDRLVAGYGGTTVLRDVSLTVPAGSVVALLGANGAGKTTLLRSVSGLLPAKEGKVVFGGRDITAEPAHRRSQHGLCHITEGRGIFRGLTVRENLQLQVPKSRAAEAVSEAVSHFPPLKAKLSQAAGTMSGGQQQMLALAAAYLRQPALLLVDEPSLGLAPIVVDEVFGFLAECAAAGTAILVVDQFVNRVLEMSATVYVLRRGEIVHSGPAGDLDAGEVYGYYVGPHQAETAVQRRREAWH